MAKNIINAAMVMPLPSQEDITYKCIKIDGESVAIPLCLFICERGGNAKLQDAKFIFENGIHWYVCEREIENRVHIEKEIGDRRIGVIRLLDCPDKARLSREAEKMGLHGPLEAQA